MRRFTTRSARIHVEYPVRRAVRAALAAITVTGAIAALAVASVPAQAATTTSMSLRTMGGDRQVTAAWSSVASATGYTVHWGAGTSTAKILHTTGTTIRINGVSNGTSYSVRVTADGTDAASPRRTATPSPYSPTPITSVKAVPGGPNQIQVSWTGGGRARSIAVYVGADSQTKTYHYATAWHPAALSTWTVNLPPSIQGVLGAGTGNAVFVRVVQTNSTATKPAMEWYFDGATKFRLSDVGPWTFAGAATSTAPTSPITVASWNAQAIAASAGFHPQDQWTARLPKVVANLENLHPDVIGFQELGTSRVDPNCRNSPSDMDKGIYDCQEQYQTLADAVGTRSSTVPTVYKNVRDDTNAYQYQQGIQNGIVDSSIFYNPSTVTLVDSYFISPAGIMGAQWPSDYGDEAGVWAEFQLNDGSGRRFLMASIHMPAGGHDVEQVRHDEGVALAAWMDQKAAALGGLPVIITGDFNGDGVTDPQAANLRMIADGYTDAAATSDRGDIRWATDNLTNGPDGVDEGYPVTAVPHLHWAGRIDYLMLKGGITSSKYRNEIRYTIDSDGTKRFVPGFQGSDHNMQLAWLGIPDPGQG